MATGLKSLRNLLLIRFISFNLSLADYGIWEQTAVGIALALPWVTLQLPSALLRFLPGVENNGRWRDEFYSVLTFVLSITSLLAQLVWIGLSFLKPYPHLEPFAVHAGPISLLIPLAQPLILAPLCCEPCAECLPTLF
jgi:O-antigen/teichoic acid export membrane protein